MRFNKLEVPYQWKDYFTKYPHGFTIWEALCSWTKQVDDMVVNQNQWNDYLDNFIDNFHFELKSEVTATLEAWQLDGTLDDIITDALLSQVTKVANKIDRQHIDVTDPPGDLIPAKGDGITNDAPAIQAIINYADHGDKLFFPNKVYSCDQPIIIDKAVSLVGDNLADNWGSKLVFNNSSGLVFNIGQVIVQGLTIMGNDKLYKDIINIENQQFGNVGLRFNYDGTHTSSGVKVERCVIKNFNVGVAIYNTMTSGNIWSGAYREFKNNIIEYNDIGVLALNGVTFDRFLGGTISKNYVHGVYMKARPETSPNHLSFTGIAFEANGPIITFLDNPDHVDYGIVVGEYSTANFDKCYFEQIAVFADKGGTIVIDKSHIHRNAKLFGRGAINVDNGPGPYKNVFKYTVDLPTRVIPMNDEVITVGDIYTPSFDVTLDKLGGSFVYLPSTLPRGLKAGNLKYLKLSCQYEMLSGFNNPYFGVSPRFRINTRGTSIDGQNNLLSYPPAAIQPTPEPGVLQNIEIFYHPRVMTGYLDPNEYINDITAIIDFSNYKHDEDDFRSTPVSVRIYNPVVTLYSDIELSVDPDIWYINEKIV